MSAHLTQSVATGCRQSWQPVASCYRCDLRLTIDPKGLWVCCSWQSARPGQHVRASEQAQDRLSPEKIDVTSKSPVGDISVVTLIRTDTTLDHSQKAEKVWGHMALLRAPASQVNDHEPWEPPPPAHLSTSSGTRGVSTQTFLNAASPRYAAFLRNGDTTWPTQQAQSTQRFYATTTPRVRVPLLS